jgi:hypothetical protein
MSKEPEGELHSFAFPSDVAKKVPVFQSSSRESSGLAINDIQGLKNANVMNDYSKPAKSSERHIKKRQVPNSNYESSDAEPNLDV